MNAENNAVTIEIYHGAFLGDRAAMTKLYMYYYKDICRIARACARKNPQLMIVEEDWIQDLSEKFVEAVSQMGRKYRRESGESLSHIKT